MAANIASSEIEQIEETLAHPTKWLGEKLQDRAASVATSDEQRGTDVTLYAHIQTAEKVSSVVMVATWKVSELYAYSDAPRIELLNVFGQILDACDNLAKAYDEEDFELKTIDLWAQFARLNNFLGISPKHDELIATLQILPTGSNSVLDKQKLSGIVSSLTLLHQSINVTDALLDQIEDSLESAGFDLEAPMAFTHISG